MIFSAIKKYRDTYKVSGLFKVEGFTYAGTANRDYGQGIIRISTTFLRNNAPHVLDWRRHQLVRLRNVANNKSLCAILRLIDTDEDNLICLEYDDRIKLGIMDKGKVHKMLIKKASGFNTFLFYWAHPNNLVRIDFKLSVYLTVVSIVLGVLISLWIPIQ